MKVALGYVVESMEVKYKDHQSKLKLFWDTLSLEKKYPHLIFHMQRRLLGGMLAVHV